MPWRGEKRALCKVCRQPRLPDETFSARGMHVACGERLRHANAMQLHEHNGPFFDYWRRQCLAALGVTTLDEARPPAQTADD